MQGSTHCLSRRSDHATSRIAQVSATENEPELSFCCCNNRPWASPGCLVTCFSLSPCSSVGVRKSSSEPLSIYAKHYCSPDRTLGLSGNSMVLANLLRGLCSVPMHGTAVTWLAPSSLFFPTRPLDIPNTPPQQYRQTLNSYLHVEYIRRKKRASAFCEISSVSQMAKIMLLDLVL